MTCMEKVRDRAAEVFAALDELCQLPAERLAAREDRTDAWSVAEHLEHVSLANHFLLLTATKGTAKALRRAAGGRVPEGETDLAVLADIADPDAFLWLPPTHMIPTGCESISTVREKLLAQYHTILELLAQIPSGEGRLCILHMSVNSLGTIDLYQWLYFITQHARYHITLISRIQ
ncbi:DinB family protein [Geomonas sp. RF6]|uniref:DinB family protein n=1 Tax=Geomonas sp. RF6 TaxID=2897342 RepID=UPI001E4B43D8|nr:DinB family protein [Geomonas sp. RF6]UFS71393.1 DinB family protein [Geomonas sp. RF6]